jgi:heterodisulfide reductase subunit B2
MNTPTSYTLFRCCITSEHLPEYEQATDAVLAGLELDMIEVREFGCCGYPLRNVDQKAWLLASGRNLALAEACGATMVTVCNCCYGTLKHCAWTLARNPALLAEINASLRKEGLCYRGTAQVRHFYELLDQDVGLDALRLRVRQPAYDLNLAVHYGCRILRPSGVCGLDNPFRPTLVDRLVQALGARSVDWKRKTDCCGAPVMATDRELSEAIAASKVSDARDAGAEAICAACPFCVLRLDRSGEAGLPVISYPQLLARSMGIVLPVQGGYRLPAPISASP